MARRDRTCKSFRINHSDCRKGAVGEPADYNPVSEGAVLSPGGRAVHRKLKLLDSAVLPRRFADACPQTISGHQLLVRDETSVRSAVC